MSRSTRLALLALPAALALILTASVSSEGEAPGLDTDAPAEVVTTRLAPPDELAAEHDRRAAARARRAAEGAPVEALGGPTREARDAARAEEAEMAARNRRYVFESNILGLYAAAAEAEADGHPEQAALMRRRAQRLSLRLAKEAQAG